MTSLKVTKSVLRNFLGTYVSRYSDFDGYWLFPQLVSELRDWSIDLLGSEPATETQTPRSAAVWLARRRFCEQAAKAGVGVDRMRAASLVIRKSDDMREGSGHLVGRSGYDVVFTVQATMDSGRTFRAESSVFIAPHDPGRESRSNRRNET